MDKARKYAEDIESDTLREIYLEYTGQLIGKKGGYKIFRRIRHHVDFFQKFERAFGDAGPVEAVTVQDIFGREWVRRYSVPYSFLLKHGVVIRHDRNLLHIKTHDTIQDNALASVKGCWYEKELLEYYTFLKALYDRYQRCGWTGKDIKYTERTVTTNLKAARKFLATLNSGANAISQITQLDLETFLYNHKGYRSGISQYIRFLNRRRKVFGAIQLSTKKVRSRRKEPTKKRTISTELFLPYNTYMRLLTGWLEPKDADVKKSLICLLMLLYAQRTPDIVALRLSDVTMKKGEYRIHFQHITLTLDEDVGVVMGRYLQMRKALCPIDTTEENLYLFPGRMHGGHLHEASVYGYMTKYRVTSDMLFATAIIKAYENGLRHPGMLTDAFGIHIMTANRYFDFFNAGGRDEVASVLDHGDYI